MKLASFKKVQFNNAMAEAVSLDLVNEFISCYKWNRRWGDDIVTSCYKARQTIVEAFWHEMVWQ